MEKYKKHRNRVFLEKDNKKSRNESSHLVLVNTNTEFS